MILATLTYTAYYMDGSGVDVQIVTPRSQKLCAGLLADGSVTVHAGTTRQGPVRFSRADKELAERVLRAYVATLPATLRATLARVAAMSPAARSAYFARVEAGEEVFEGTMVESFERRAVRGDGHTIAL